MKIGLIRNTLLSVCAAIGFLVIGCQSSTEQSSGSSAGGNNASAGMDNSGGTSSVGGSTLGGTSFASGGTAASSTASTATSTGGATTTGGTSSTGTSSASNISVSLSESAYRFDTPDLTHTLSVTVSGAGPTTVTWTSSDPYIATVSAAGVVTSVSGGQATITATSSIDTTKSATATVTVSEPNRAKAASFVDAKSIKSGPVNILMCGDSLMRTYAANAADQTGWGQVLSQFFTNDVTVDNSIPNGGRSSRSFYNEIGRWDVVKTRLAAAQLAGTPTYVFIMFGHNDEKKLTDTNGADYLTFASVNPNGTVAGTFFDYLERYIVETRALGGIPVLFTPFVREYLEGSPATVSATGQHNITTAYAGEAKARGDYPAAMKAVAAKHDVPVVDITSFSKTMVEERAANDSLSYIYIASDQTHVRNLGALLMAQEAARALNAQGILTSYAKTVAPKVMLDAGSLAFGGLYNGTSQDKTFRVSPYGNVTGTLTVTAPSGYSVSTDGTTFNGTASIPCDSNYLGSVLTVRFSPTDAVAYNGNLLLSHSSITPDYGNTVPNTVAGAIALTGNGKLSLSGTPASATWAMFTGTTIALGAVTTGAITAAPATLSGLVNKSVANGAARFDTPTGVWPAEGSRNATRYIEFALPVTTGSFILDTVSADGGTGGGSNIRWDVVYSLTADFATPTVLGASLTGAKDTLVSNSYPGLGVSSGAGQTLFLRVYPYATAALTSGKSFMVANVVVSGVTNL